MIRYFFTDVRLIKNVKCHLNPEIINWMSSFSICRLFSGSLLQMPHTLAHMWITALPNQILGKAANFIMRPAWPVTSFMLITCVHRVSAAMGNKKKTKNVGTAICVPRLRQSSPLIHPTSFFVVGLNFFPLYHHIGICVQQVDQTKKISIAQEKP